MIVYMDASAVVKRVLEEPGSELVEEVLGCASEVVASDLVEAEARAALAALRRSGRIDANGERRAASRAEELLRGATIVATDESIEAAAGPLAARHGILAPEAVDLAALLTVDAPRVVVTTWSGGLARAAHECGMPVLPRPARPLPLLSGIGTASG